MNIAGHQPIENIKDCEATLEASHGLFGSLSFHLISAKMVALEKFSRFSWRIQIRKSCMTDAHEII